MTKTIRPLGASAALDRSHIRAAPSSAQTFAVYARANTLASDYWQRIVDDARVSAEFRAICVANAATVRAARADGN